MLVLTSETRWVMLEAYGIAKSDARTDATRRAKFAPAFKFLTKIEPVWANTREKRQDERDSESAHPLTGSTHDAGVDPALQPPDPGPLAPDPGPQPPDPGVLPSIPRGSASRPRSPTLETEESCLPRQQSWVVPERCCRPVGP